MNFLIHLKELKYRFVYFLFSFILTFIICFYFRVELFFLISSIFLSYGQSFIYTGLFEPLIIYFKLSFLFSFFFTFPINFYIFSFFFLRSFYNFYTFYYFFYISCLYFLTILIFILFLILIFPLLIIFLLNFQRSNNLEIFELLLQATINQYYNFFFNYIKIYFLLICIPNIFFLLVLIKLINKEFFFNYKFRKYLYLNIFIFFFIFAPPDLFLQILILPLIIFILEIFIYFISFFLILYYLF